KAPPQRVAWTTTYRVVVQFPERAALEAFRREEGAYREQRQIRLVLAPGQRAELFDALEEVRALAPQDRRGERLAAEGTPGDRPPLLPDMPLTIFDPVEPPERLNVPPPDGPLACVVDSGVVAGHPLLSGTVVDERDFDSGENTAVDRAGHGTHVAGIVFYGDV